MKKKGKTILTFVLMLAAIFCLTYPVHADEYSNQYYNIKNKATGQYMHIEHLNATLEMGEIQSEWHSARWAFDVRDNGSWIRNRWNFFRVFVDTNGNVQTGYGGAGRLEWTIEQYDGYVRFKNIASGTYLYANNGENYARAGNVNAADEKSHWILIPVSE
ncbi:MAG TPA: RICIN domain-containing protein [Firmicutes bacterium]|nr:RICIN domain-containing protein [Bacillota bacterium]